MDSHPSTIELWDAVEAQQYADEVFAVYDAVFGDRSDPDDWRTGLYDLHCARDGFRLAAARDAGQLIGCAWGYLGAVGQFWDDWVLDVIPAEVTRTWLGGHFELVELAVVSSHRRRGYGRRLHDVILDGVTADKALLSTENRDCPAVRLYTSHGWRKLGELNPDVQLMGLRLPASGPTGDGG